MKFAELCWGAFYYHLIAWERGKPDKIYFEAIGNQDLISDFNSLKGQSLEKYNFEQEALIIKIYNQLGSIPRFGPTAISKTMHIMNPELFVMWDDDIYKAYCQKYGWFGKPSSIYLEFFKKMKEEANEVIQDFQEQGFMGNPADFLSQRLDYSFPKTLAKFIDEYNFVIHTKRFNIPPKEYISNFLRFLVSSKRSGENPMKGG